jgi:hypothetical protein
VLDTGYEVLRLCGPHLRQGETNDHVVSRPFKTRVILCVPEVTGVGVMIGNFINCMQPGGYDNRRWSRKEDSGKTFVFIRWSHSDHGQQAVVFSAKGLDPSKMIFFCYRWNLGLAHECVDFGALRRKRG